MSARVVMKLVVAARDELSAEVVRLTFAHPKKPALPPWEPGAHVDLRLPEGGVRQYSLIGDPADLSTYSIAVKREPAGRGGSVWAHGALAEGTEARVSGARNHFPLADGPAALIAGGVGATPMVAMARRLRAEGRLVAAHLCERARPSAFAPMLREVCGDALVTHVSEDGAGARLDIPALIAALAPDVHVYCCGPSRMIQAVEAATQGRPEEQTHFEIFTPLRDEDFTPEPFELTIASTGETRHVPADRSALDVLRDAGLPVPSSCELGVCGSCECGYLAGEVIHRDRVLRPKARKSRMTPCVSRARGRLIVAL